MESNFKITWKIFSELTTQELYDILLLREAVFQLEQKCLYPDIDNQDQGALHLLIYDDLQLVGYLRLFTPDTAKILITESNQAGAYTDKNTCRFGRFVIHEKYRGLGLGNQLVQVVLGYCEKNYPGVDITIAAQAYLERYYKNFGFVTTSSAYDDFGIAHIDMSKKSV